MTNVSTNSNNENKVRVLWFSRHTMTVEQENALVAKLGPICINQVDKTVNSAFELQDEVNNADVVAIVAPINLQQQFLKIAGDKPVITAISKRELVPDENGGESKAVFIFQEWQQIKKIDVITEHFA